MRSPVFATKPTLRYSASKKAMRSECTHMGTYFELKCTHLRNMAALNGWFAGQTGTVPRGTRGFVPAEQPSAIRARHPAGRPREAPGHWLVRSKTFRAYENQRRRMSAVERTPNVIRRVSFVPQQGARRCGGGQPLTRPSARRTSRHRNVKCVRQPDERA